MRKINKISVRLFSAMILLGMIFSLGACANTEMENRFVPDNNSVTFESSVVPKSVLINDTELKVKIVRGIANEAIDVPIEFTTETNGVFGLSSSFVSFAKGEFETDVILTCASSTLVPGTQYSFNLSFDEADKAFTGVNDVEVRVMLQLEYSEVGTVEFKTGSFSSLIAEGKDVYKLYLADNTTQFYKIEGFYGSSVDFEFKLDEGMLHASSPVQSFYNASDVAGYPLLKFESAIVHPSYGPMTAWVDADPAYVTASELSPTGQFASGSIITADVWYTVGAGYFGWYTDTFEVTLK